MSGPGVARRRPLCSEVSRSSGEQPWGSAHRWDSCVAFEALPHEWDVFRDPARWSAAQRQVMEVLGDWVGRSGLGYGWLMFMPPDRRVFDPARREVRVYTRPAGDFFGGYRKQRFRADEAGVWSLFAQAVAGVDGFPGVAEPWPDAAQAQAQAGEGRASAPDWHVCTHGRVDAACGKYGGALFQALAGPGAAAPAPHIWRTSHFGGHRFAPTALELPAGRSWAHLTPALTRQLLSRRGDPCLLADHYRGCSAFGPAGQRADAAMFRAVGWEWLDTPRRITVVQESDEGFVADVSYRLGHLAGGRQTRRVTGECTGCLDLPSGSHAPDLFPAPQYRVTVGPAA